MSTTDLSSSMKYAYDEQNFSFEPGFETRNLLALDVTNPTNNASLFYPSPPSTNRSQSAPLPTLYVNSGPFYSTKQPTDSSLVIYHDIFTPLSPPPTIPTSTLALPFTDNQSTSSSTALLSPLSPEWISNSIDSDENKPFPWDPPPISPISSLEEQSPTLSSPLFSFSDLDYYSPSSFDLESSDEILRGSSSSLRSCKSLPDVSPESSPGAPMVALPGAQVDDTLFDPELSSLAYNPDLLPAEELTPLLFDISPVNSPPRSPSPDNADDLELATIAECSDPDVHRLLDLKRRSQTALKNAKSLEQQMMEGGWVQKGAEARQTRKKEKERSREISALLRLKLSAPSSPPKEQPPRETEITKRLQKSPGGKPKPPKTAVSNMAQLVARMMLRRNEAGGSLSNANPPLAKLSAWSRNKSKLSRYSYTPEQHFDRETGFNQS
ncbi:hypothetical protein C8J56DRAFT_1092265 [Mycena floridula]|nr:hypothetical protein C8J56DRAFT_1092265 [Mycena floridula]